MAFEAESGEAVLVYMLHFIPLSTACSVSDFLFLPLLSSSLTPICALRIGRAPLFLVISVGHGLYSFQQ